MLLMFRSNVYKKVYSGHVMNLMNKMLAVDCSFLTSLVELGFIILECDSFRDPAGHISEHDAVLID